MAQSTPVIAIKQDFDPDELPRIHLQQEYNDGTKTQYKPTTSTLLVLLGKIREVLKVLKASYRTVVFISAVLCILHYFRSVLFGLY
jgi:hypothetical protein